VEGGKGLISKFWPQGEWVGREDLDYWSPQACLWQ